MVSKSRWGDNQNGVVIVTYILPSHLVGGCVQINPVTICFVVAGTLFHAL